MQTDCWQNDKEKRQSNSRGKKEKENEKENKIDKKAYLGCLPSCTTSTMTISAVLLAAFFFFPGLRVTLGSGHSQGRGLAGMVSTSCMPFLGPWVVP